MITNLELWENQVKINDDPYGKATIDVAREVMRLLDTDEYKDFDCHQIICTADKNVDAGGITGFMAGCVAQIVVNCHSRGKEFREKWNLSYNVTEEKAKGGVVNPAILTLNV
jgi:hypothetical protein